MDQGVRLARFRLLGEGGLSGGQVPAPRCRMPQDGRLYRGAAGVRGRAQGGSATRLRRARRADGCTRCTGQVDPTNKMCQDAVAKCKEMTSKASSGEQVPTMPDGKPMPNLEELVKKLHEPAMLKKLREHDKTQVAPPPSHSRPGAL